MPKVSEVMVTAFRMQPVGKLSGLPEIEVGALDPEFLVVTAKGLPVSLLRGKSVGALSRKGAVPRLPVTPVVSQEADFGEVVRELAPLLLRRRELAGAVVFGDGKVHGVLSRKLIAKEVGKLLGTPRFRLPGAALQGNPQVRGRIYECPNGDYSKRVSYYPSRPLRCPNDGAVLKPRV